MSWFDPIPAEELGATFTHYGWFCGLVPIYIGKPHSNEPLVAERNWVPAWWLSFVAWLFGCFCAVATAIDPDCEPLFPIQITGRIKAAPQ